MRSSRKTKSRPSAMAQTGAHSHIAVWVQPCASSNRLSGKTTGEWKVALMAPAIEGRANRACIRFLAGLLRVPPSSITITRGEASRHKVLKVDGLQQPELERKLEHAAAS